MERGINFFLGGGYITVVDHFNPLYRNMNSKRKNYATALYTLLCGAFFDFYSWGLLQQNKQMPTNAFLHNCFSSLSRSFPLQVINLFDNTKGVVSIRKYLTEIKKSSVEKDKKLFKMTNDLLNKNNDKITRHLNRRGNDLAHTNFEIIEEILNAVPKEKRGEKSKKSTITKKETIELLLLAEKIIKAIIVHEMSKLINPQNTILPRIKQDFEKILGIETADNTG